MASKKRFISLKYIVTLTLVFVGMVPLLITGWFLSEGSARELRSAEGRYQTQLVQDKARQIELFGQSYVELVRSFAKALEIADNEALLSSVETQKELGATLEERPQLLALIIKPVSGESLSAFRSELIDRGEIERLSETALGDISDSPMSIGQPTMIPRTGEVVFTIAIPVVNDGELSAAVVAIVSLDSISTIASERPVSEAELWDAGLPIIFVVDEAGKPIYHPNSAVLSSRRPLIDIRIVSEWLETRDQIQSALLPFNVERDAVGHDMIGAYSTASIFDQLKFGVIVMQEESKALASVGEMRRQTWLISLAFALIALLLGLFSARQLSLPILNLVSVAQKIASGDLSTRIETKSITEIGTLGEAFNTMSDELEEHIAKLAKAAKENKELFVGTVKALAAAIDGKDRYTRGHSERVSRVSVAIGQRLQMDEEELEKLRISALLHDVGKIGIDDSILKKPAALTAEEYEIMKTHPQQGYKIMKNIPAMKDFLPGMYMHHEMVNGEGYPQGLKDEQIPLQAKIVSVADTFDAMTIDRPYSKGMALGEALDKIESFVGSRYDPDVVSALRQACEDGQIGVGRVKLKKFAEKPSNSEGSSAKRVA
ncbi:MAG: HD domain-containing protein [Acidobacteria bacterium]|nr:MAG: HD domain-containing protein [Acidobacteriota bacterium]REK01373.1 MAG: HD domain-containing protein [Acidobacteriota bacterium]REK14329.1 MAG: HD domain-containing protein [Acidobacteriota bacterium]REK45044.1 MAG: HD domain-containing protein [Acidobacteriota bacterium]